MMNPAQHRTLSGIPYRVRMASWVPRMVGHQCLTLRRTIYCRSTRMSAHLHAHEAAHVEQFAELGVLRFLWRYLWAQLRYGYAKNPLEIAAHLYADTHEADYAPLYVEGHP